MEERFRDEISGLRGIREILHDLFRIAPQQEKGDTLRRIKEVDRRISDLEVRIRRAVAAGV
ncbi:MAG TPA: hypothetical protein VFG95_10625 [Nitrospiria bacterium]|nr:hypothetical protein [Nitrospiria bacterium]